MADLIEASSACFLPSTVVLELEWVPCGAYQLPREAIIRALRGPSAIRHLHLRLEQEEEGLQALEAYGQGLDFAAAVKRGRNYLVDTTEGGTKRKGVPCSARITKKFAFCEAYQMCFIRFGVCSP